MSSAVAIAVVVATSVIFCIRRGSFVDVERPFASLVEFVLLLGGLWWLGARLFHVYDAIFTVLAA